MHPRRQTAKRAAAPLATERIKRRQTINEVACLHAPGFFTKKLIMSSFYMFHVTLLQRAALMTWSMHIRPHEGRPRCPQAWQDPHGTRINQASAKIIGTSDHRRRRHRRRHQNTAVRRPRSVVVIKTQLSVIGEVC